MPAFLRKEKDMTHYLFVVLGAGGTGGNFAKELVRFLASSKRTDCKVLLIDGDTVEEKNLIRQPFITGDIGKNKAEVLAGALSETFEGFPVAAYGNYIDDEKALNSLITGCITGRNSVLSSPGDYHPSLIPVLIGAVDNHACRKIMEQFFSRYSGPVLYYFDAANETSSGEVVFSSIKEGCIFSPPRSFYFPEVLSEKHISRLQMSCEELNNVAPQHIVTNIKAANILLTACCGLINFGVPPKGIVYFDTASFSECRKDPSVFGFKLVEKAGEKSA